SGLAAYVLLTVSMALGLSVSTRATDLLSKRAHVNEGHQTLSVLAGVLIGMHVGLLLAHSYVRFSLVEVLVPFASSWRPIPAAMGTISMYLVAVVLLTSALREHMSYRAWRVLHFVAFPAWAMATIHGIFAGSDSQFAAIQYMYLTSFALVLLLIAFGVFAPRKGVQRTSGPPAAAPEDIRRLAPDS
ncbi:MAG: ferric reductase-like transmembrane domain-containing protein, partial [Dehalococcoidia bacterium]